MNYEGGSAEVKRRTSKVKGLMYTDLMGASRTDKGGFLRDLSVKSVFVRVPQKSA